MGSAKSSCAEVAGIIYRSSSANREHSHLHRNVQKATIPSFAPTSSPELDELLLTYRTKVFTPHALQKYHRDLMYKPSRHQILLNDPGVTVTLSNDEEVKLMPMDPHDKPNKAKSLTTLIKLLESSSESSGWNNLPPFLEGMVMAREKLPEGWLQKVVRKANERGKSGVIIRCAEMVKKTGVNFSDPPIAEEMMLGCHIRAAQANWTGKEAEKAMKQAEQVALMMESKYHCGGKLTEGQEDMRKSMMVIGVLLELTAARALYMDGGKDVDSKVVRYAENALLLCQKDSFQLGNNHIEAAKGLERWLPLWAGLNMVQKVDGVQQGSLAGSLKEQAERLEVVIKEAKAQVEEQARAPSRMATADTYLERLDTVLITLFASWNVYTTIFATALLVYLAYPLLTWRDPDTHPLLLARQASTSPVRQQGESAIYRSIEVPYGYPLRAGLGVKDPGAPKWSGGRNGDLRDIWRAAARGAIKEDGSPSGQKGKVITILGKEKTIEHDLDDMTQGINVIGKYVKDSNGRCAAICLSNSTQLLSSIFAAAFYGFRSVLVPHHLDTGLLIAHLAKATPDFLIAEAGALQVDAVVASCPSLRYIIWVAKAGNRHMDWNVVPEGTGSKVEVVVWHELIDERRNLISSEVLPVDKDSSVQPLSTFWPANEGVGELVEYTSENLISATSALISALPRTQRIGPDDLLLLTSSLMSSYPLCLTFAALYSNASVALNSVTSENVNFSIAASGVTPTIVVTSSKTILDYHAKAMGSQTGLTASISRLIQKQTLQAGNMPSRNAIARLAEIDTRLSLSNLRLLFVAHRAGDQKSPQLQSSVLADLRMMLGSRIGYALTTGQVAGAVCQTNVLDYRQTLGFNTFGPPLSSVEITLTGDEERVSKQDPRGKIVVKGPAVCKGLSILDVEGQIGNDNTLSLP